MLWLIQPVSLIISLRQIQVAVSFFLFCFVTIIGPFLFFFPANISETITDEVLQRLYGPDTVVAEIKYQSRPPQQIRLSDIPVTEKLEKFVEDVK